MKRKIITTEDGSSSIYVEDLNESYHSIHGAIQESEHIFIKSGLLSDMLSNLDKVSILEIGFGTGLNALLTYYSAIEIQKQIHYTAVELYPITQEELQLLNYTDKLPYVGADKVFSHIHSLSWEVSGLVDNHFTIIKHRVSALEIQLPDNTFDLVYFDAFSPTTQPELWSEDLFNKIYNSMKQGAIFVTYSTKGDVKRALKHSGFRIEKLQGPIGKREILRGIK